MRAAMGELPAGRLVVVYGHGAASPTEILAAARGLVEPVFVMDSRDPHTRALYNLVGEMAATVDLAATPLTQVADRLRVDAAGIVTFSESMLRPTAHLADLLGLPFHTPRTASMLTDKYLQRQALNSAGVSPTRHRSEEHTSELQSQSNLV